jgi:hypothetical protein
LTAKKQQSRIKYNGKVFTRAELTAVVFKEAERYKDDPEYRISYIRTVLGEYGIKVRLPMTHKQKEKAVGWSIGVLFLVAIFVANLFLPNPSPSQANILRIFIAVMGAAFAAFIPGLLNIDISENSGSGKVAIRATGALAVFIIIYLWDPAKGIY